MIVPGSLLIVLFTKDYELQSIWGDYFGNDTVANTIILLIAGYLIGMLIHELGDLLEKQLWKMSRLNPRYYAAKEVFLNVEKNINTLILTSGKCLKKSAKRTMRMIKIKNSCCYQYFYWKFSTSHCFSYLFF